MNKFLSPRMSRKLISPVNGKEQQMLPGGKPPKLHHLPGWFYLLDNQPVMLAYCYRVKDDPTRWLFRLEELDSYTTLRDAEANPLDKKRWICYDLFHSGLDTFGWFAQPNAMGHSSSVKDSAGMKLLRRLEPTDSRVLKALGERNAIGDAAMAVLGARSLEDKVKAEKHLTEEILFQLAKVVK